MVLILHRERLVKQLISVAFLAAVLLTTGQLRGTAHAADRLELHITPSVSLAPASVIVRAIVEHDADNRELEIVAESPDFYRRSVVDLDGDQAPKTTELRLIDIPGGEYEVTAVLYTAHGEKTMVRKSIMVMSHTTR